MPDTSVHSVPPYVGTVCPVAVKNIYAVPEEEVPISTKLPEEEPLLALLEALQ